jgi:HlyD family secretion protein
MNYLNKFLTFLKTKYFYIVLLIILVIGGVFLFKNKNSNTDTIQAAIGNFTNEVSISGKVIASSDVSLGFSSGGRISSVRVLVGNVVSSGTVLASVENGDLQADLAQKEAILEKEQINLKSLQNGTRSEQIAITESSVLSAKTTFSQSKQSIINAINDAYTKSDDAIKNKIDQFFKNPLSSPYIVLFVNDSTLISSINKDRESIGNMLTTWENSVSKLNSDTNLDQYISEAEKNMNQMKSFLAKVSLVTNNPDVTDNGGASIPSSWKTDTSTARLAIDTVISNLASNVTVYKNAQSELTTRENNLKLEQAGATKEDIEGALAQIKSAQASVDSTKANLQKTLIVAPFNGIITKIDAKVGQVASSNTPLVQMMSVGTFQIESFVPEVSIALIKLGDIAKVTLDAYGESEFFNAKVVLIDPAETIRDGVSTYKIKLQFSEIDKRIKSGMTANVSIATFSKENVIVMPGGVVVEKDGKKFVQIKQNEEIITREIVTGSVSSLGQVEVVSGINDKELIILNPQIK